jgi:hypothetical protein
MKTKEKTDLNKSIGPSPSVIDEKNEPYIVDKDNFRYNELEGMIDSTGNVDNGKKSVYDVKDKEVGSLTEIIRPLEEGETGNDQSRGKEGLIFPEMDNTPEKHIRRKPVIRNSDFLWGD